MKCPHCLEGFHEDWEEQAIGSDKNCHWKLKYCFGPECEKIILMLSSYTLNSLSRTMNWKLSYPKGISRNPLQKEVNDQNVISDYNEACLVLNDSPKASAALSRRCLQYILREKAKVKPSNLDSEIQEVIDSKRLPSDLADNLDCIRVIGNFAAHPIKSKNSGEIVDVEPGEAEWNLDVIEDLIDFYFVRPAKTREKKKALNLKLQEVGKPELSI